MYQTARRGRGTLSKEDLQMSLKRIDVHHHFLTPEYVEELAKVGVVEAGGVPLAQLERWKPEDSLDVMDRYGIETALLSVSSPGLCFGDTAKARDMARSLNEFAAGCAIRRPRRFGFFAVLPLPDVEATLDSSFCRKVGPDGEPRDLVASSLDSALYLLLLVPPSLERNRHHVPYGVCLNFVDMVQLPQSILEVFKGWSFLLRWSIDVDVHVRHRFALLSGLLNIVT